MNLANVGRIAVDLDEVLPTPPHPMQAYHRGLAPHRVVRTADCLVLCTCEPCGGSLAVRANTTGGALVGVVANEGEARALAKTCGKRLVVSG